MDSPGPSIQQLTEAMHIVPCFLDTAVRSSVAALTGKFDEIQPPNLSLLLVYIITYVSAPSLGHIRPVQNACVALTPQGLDFRFVHKLLLYMKKTAEVNMCFMYSEGYL